MRETTTKIKKSVFRIAICSIGGVLIILGILLGLSVLLQLPDESKYLLLFILAVLFLSVGLYLCFSVIKPMQYFVKSQKMSGEEKAIENIKRYLRQSRKSRIIALSIFLIVSVSMLIWIITVGIELIDKITTKETKLVSFFHLIVWHYLIAASVGALLGALMNEFSGLSRRNKHKLTVNMWERIQELENEVKELKAGAQVDDQQNE